MSSKKSFIINDPNLILKRDFTPVEISFKVVFRAEIRDN